MRTIVTLQLSTKIGNRTSLIIVQKQFLHFCTTFQYYIYKFVIFFNFTWSAVVLLKMHSGSSISSKVFINNYWYCPKTPYTSRWVSNVGFFSEFSRSSRAKDGLKCIEKLSVANTTIFFLEILFYAILTVIRGNISFMIPTHYATYCCNNILSPSL